MIFVVDESVDIAIGKLFQKLFEGTILISETNTGVTDEKVIEIANELNAGIISLDKDFGELLVRQNKNAKCLILIRLKRMNIDTKLKLIENVMMRLKDNLDLSFIIITPTAYRLRKLKLE